MREEMFEGWRCARVDSGDLTAWVTLDVGPRVIGLSYQGEANLFYVKPETRGRTDLEGYNGYGGHRLWTAPEIVSRTYEPENDPVDVWEGAHEDEECPSMREFFAFRAPLGASLLEKIVFLMPFEGGLEVSHTIGNHGPVPQEVAPWAVTVMRPGGECLIPGHALQTPAPSASKLPSRPLVLWPYTKMNDPRYTWDGAVVRLAQNPLVDGATKFGTFIGQGMAIYATDGVLFIKRFSGNPHARYPDFGCNFEAFTRHDMLEVETLGPLHVLRPGESCTHNESWFVLEGAPPETNFGEWFDEIAEITWKRRFSRTP